MKATLYSKNGKKNKEVELNPEIYGVRVNERLLQLVHVAYRRNLRRGTAKTKERAEVRGGGKKPWKQKGTGRARASTNRSPLWTGGGTTFGPRPRDYSVAMSTGMRRSALISALSLRATKSHVMLLEDLNLETAKTKELAKVMMAMPASEKRALWVVREMDQNLKRACQNLKYRADFKTASEFNAEHVLSRPNLIIAEGALPVIEERLLSSKKIHKAKTKSEESKEE